MFLEILQTLMKVLMVFSILIIAFGLAFFILMSKVMVVYEIDSSHKSQSTFIPQTSQNQSANHLSFSSIPMSLLRTFSMMLGEMDFVGTYVQPFYTNELTFPIPTFLLLCKNIRLCHTYDGYSLLSFRSRSIHDSYADPVDESTDWFGCWRYRIGSPKRSAETFGYAGMRFILSNIFRINQSVRQRWFCTRNSNKNCPKCGWNVSIKWNWLNIRTRWSASWDFSISFWGNGFAIHLPTTVRH